MHSFRDLLLFGIGFAIQQNRNLLRRLLKERVTDDARGQLAKKVLEHLELFDEEAASRSEFRFLERRPQCILTSAA